MGVRKHPWRSCQLIVRHCVNICVGFLAQGNLPLLSEYLTFFFRLKRTSSVPYRPSYHHHNHYPMKIFASVAA